MQIKNFLFCVTVKETEKIINVNKENTRSLQNCELAELIKCIEDISKVDRGINGNLIRTTASKEVLNYLDEWLKLLVNKLKNCDLETLEVITEILRFLRNCTVDCVTQQYILGETNILNSLDSLFSIIVDTDINNITLKVLLQFLINLISSNKDAGEKIFTIFYDRVKTCLKANIYLYETSALIYYISLIKPINDTELITKVLELYCTNAENEFLIFFVENNISNGTCWEVYVDINTENKIMVLEAVKNMQLQKKLHSLPLIALDVLIQEFLKSANSIFYVREKEEDELKAYQVSLVLEILSSLSSDEIHLRKFQNSGDLLINAGVLLINVHKLGKESNNCFTPVQRLAEFRANSGLNEHPAFGFKADLIRLIGNLCWKSADMQDLARTADLIPVILDCCNMDARNPFIIQWSILAVRNLCENNLENQKIISGLYKEGCVSSEVLDEMGMTLHSDGGSELKIVSLDSLKKV